MYASGKFKFDAVPKDTKKSAIRHANDPSALTDRPYTMLTVAKFMDKLEPKGEPKHTVKVGFQLLDAVKEGLFSRELVGTKTRNEAEVMIRGARKVKRTQEKAAQYDMEERQH